MSFPQAREWLLELRRSPSVCVPRWRQHLLQASHACQPHLPRVHLPRLRPRVRFRRLLGPLQPLPGPVRFCRDPGSRSLRVCGRRSPFVWLPGLLRPRRAPRQPLRSHRPCRLPAPQQRERRWPGRVWLGSLRLVRSCRQGPISRPSFRSRVRRVRVLRLRRGLACRCASKAPRRLDSPFIAVPFAPVSH